MSHEMTSHEIIHSALQLPEAERLEIVHALQHSLLEHDVDHGPIEPADEVESAWDAEIARRIADIDSGKVKLIPSKEAWKYIDGKTSS
jgi:putative addiction module component (TIGR02574 family)